MTAARCAGAATPITPLGGTGERSVLVSWSHGALRGSLHLAVDNPGRGAKALRLLYARNAGRTIEVLPGKTRVARLSPAKAPVVPAGSSAEINLTFKVPAGGAPDALDGSLTVEAGTGQSAVQQFTVPIAGKARPVGQVTFEPAPVVIQVTRGCPPVIFKCNTEGGSVHLYGTGVSRFVAEQGRSGQQLQGQLQADGRTPIQATLTDLKLLKNPANADARVQLEEKAKAGKYDGKLVLSRIVPDSPALAVEVRSRVWIFYAVFLVFLGVLTSGEITQRFGLRRRKKLIREALRQEVGEYCTEQGKNFPEGEDEDPLIWDPNIPCPLKENPNWKFYEDVGTTNDAYTAAKWARNDADLDEAQARTVTFIVGIKEWRLALTEVRALWDLVHETRESPDEWEKTLVAQDSKLLLLRVRRAPDDPAAGKSLREKVAQQARWHRQFAQAWDLRLRLIRAGGDAGVKASQIDLDDVLDGAKPVMKRDEDEQDSLDLKLEGTYRDLLALKTESNRDEQTEHVDVPAVSLEAEVQAAKLRTEIVALERTKANPELCLSVLGAATTLAPEPAARTASGDGETAPPPPPAPAAQTELNSGERLQRWLMARDAFLTLVILVVSSVLYSATLYTDTWGKPSDWATAFGAGFFGQVSIKWALLPLYRSIRLGSSSPAPAGGASEASA